jgi:hypothetical protein
MMPRKFLAVFIFVLMAITVAPAADEAPKPAEPGTLVVIDSAGKEQKLKSWKFTAGVQHLSFLAPAEPMKEPEPKDKEKDKSKGAPKAPPRGKPAPRGPEAFVLREANSTTWANGVITLVPLDRIRSIEFDNEKETVGVHVATSDKPADDVVLTGSTEFDGLNKLTIEAEVDKGDLGVAEVRFLGGVSKGIRGVRFPTPKVAAVPKESRPAAVTFADKKSKYVANVVDLQPLYKVADGEALSPLLFFKKTIKVDVAKFKKIVSQSKPGTVGDLSWEVVLKAGDDETLTLLTEVMLDGKPAQLEGLIGRVPAGYRTFPLHLLQEVEFDVKKDEGEAKPEKKPDDKKPDDK